MPEQLNETIGTYIQSIDGYKCQECNREIEVSEHVLVSGNHTLCKKCGRKTLRATLKKIVLMLEELEE